ncbi:hypothetical protein BRADI_3g28895v3 [Brachypodium distachyon]|uniref:Uncharacterized protein n=1 Tax=Brachypodium distachyon TaxID=15368 RepID=A0A2K2CZW3_BRADI|nr:hypothetical protein BRADI_3g28895v3 [Brachypodium distachyon]
MKLANDPSILDNFGTAELSGSCNTRAQRRADEGPSGRRHSRQGRCPGAAPTLGGREQRQPVGQRRGSQAPAAARQKATPARLPAPPALPSRRIIPDRTGGLIPLTSLLDRRNGRPDGLSLRGPIHSPRTQQQMIGWFVSWDDTSSCVMILPACLAGHWHPERTWVFRRLAGTVPRNQGLDQVC